MTSGIDILLGRAGRSSEPAAWSGEMATTPAAVGDDVYVRIPSIDGGQTRIGPTDAWMPRVDASGDAVLPAAGDRVLVVFDQDRTPWIVGWVPA